MGLLLGAEDTSQQNSIAIKKSSSKLRHGSKLIQWKSEGGILSFKAFMAAAEIFVRQAYYYYYFSSIWLSQNMQMRSHDSSQLNNLLIKMDTLFPVTLIFFY